MGAGARVQRDPLPACVRGTAGQGSAGRLLHAAEPAGFRSAGLALAPRGRGCSPRRAPGCPRRPLRARSRRSPERAGRAAERSPAERRRPRAPRSRHCISARKRRSSAPLTFLVSPGGFVAGCFPMQRNMLQKLAKFLQKARNPANTDPDGGRESTASSNAKLKSAVCFLQILNENGLILVLRTS